MRGARLYFVAQTPYICGRGKSYGMRTMSKLLKALLTVTMLGAGLGTLAQPALAQSRESPLLLMAGSWSGQGSIDFSDGSKERIRCRSNYKPDESGSNLRLELRCASDSYKFELTGNVIYKDGQVSGNWNEASRNAAGDLTGTASGGHINVRAVGQTFAAFLNINTRGSSQSVSIKSPGSKMSEVVITLARQ